MRDQKSYCGILIDDNNRKPLARLHLNRSVKYISLFDTGSEEKIAIDSLDRIYDYAARLRTTAEKYTTETTTAPLNAVLQESNLANQAE